MYWFSAPCVIVHRTIATTASPVGEEGGVVAPLVSKTDGPEPHEGTPSLNSESGENSETPVAAQQERTGTQKSPNQTPDHVLCPAVSRIPSHPARLPHLLGCTRASVSICLLVTAGFLQLLLFPQGQKHFLASLCVLCARLWLLVCHL